MGVKTASNPSDFYYSNLIEAICCPYSKQPMTHAHMVNCALKHSFSLSSLLDLFGKQVNETCEKPGPCPLCQSRVTTYWNNPQLQQLVDAIIKVQIFKSPGSKAKVQEEWRYPLETTSLIFSKLEKETYEGEGSQDHFLNLSFTGEGSGPITSLLLQGSTHPDKGELTKKDVNYIMNLSLTTPTQAHFLHVALLNQNIQTRQWDRNLTCKTKSLSTFLPAIKLIREFNVIDEKGQIQLNKFIEEFEEVEEFLKWVYPLAATSFVLTNEEKEEDYPDSWGLSFESANGQDPINKFLIGKVSHSLQEKRSVTFVMELTLLNHSFATNLLAELLKQNIEFENPYEKELSFLTEDVQQFLDAIHLIAESNQFDEKGKTKLKHFIDMLSE